MSYSLEKFSSFSQDHQFRLLYKLLRKDERVHQYAEVFTEPELSNLVLQSQDEVKRQALLAFLEKELGQSVMDGDILEFSQKDGGREIQKMPFDLVLHDLRSAHNVGAILRTAECFGFRTAYLSGYTPTPEQSVVQKTTMGVEDHIDWQNVDLEELLEQRTHLVALEMTEEAQPIESFRFEPETLFVLGNEKYGVADQVLKKADAVVSIPLFGWKNSLNVSNAFAILAHAVRTSYGR